MSQSGLKLRLPGYTLSIDDFGTGDSSLSHIQKMQPAEVRMQGHPFGRIMSLDDLIALREQRA